jgi:hypothetical protein
MSAVDETQARETGYLYRRAPLTQADVQDLIAQVFAGSAVFAFGANNVTLQPITPYPVGAPIPLADGTSALDFGHVFNDHAEVRWKRDGDRYDTLTLTENDDLVKKLQRAGATQIGVYSVVPATRQTAILLDTPPDVQARGKRWRLDYKEYVGDQAMVQFARYTTWREEDNG